jgi:hypothetical protein
MMRGQEQEQEQEQGPGPGQERALVQAWAAELLRAEGQ